MQQDQKVPTLLLSMGERKACGKKSVRGSAGRLTSGLHYKQKSTVGIH